MVVTVIVRIICTLLGRLFADEFKAWVPRMVEWLIQVAAARVPEAYRERCAEEWRSHANEVPGEVGKLVHAIGAVGAAYKMRWLETRSKPSDTFRRVGYFWGRLNKKEYALEIGLVLVVGAATSTVARLVAANHLGSILVFMVLLSLSLFSAALLSRLKKRISRPRTEKIPKRQQGRD